MKRDELEALMVSGLYGELPDEDRRLLDAWLNDHPDDRAEYEELRRTCILLDRLRTPDESKDSVVEFLPRIRDSRRRWRSWTLAAAACFAFLCVAGTQGFVLQIGSFRMGIGSPNESPDVRTMIRQELAASYKPTMDEMVKTVEAVQTSRDLMQRRQTAIEESLVDLSAVQELNKRQLQKALNEFVDDFDRRMQPYLTAMNSPAYSALPVSNRDFH